MLSYTKQSHTQPPLVRTPRLMFIYLFTCKYVCIVLYLSVAWHLLCACEGLYVLCRWETALTFLFIYFMYFCFAFHNSLCFAFSFVTICAQPRSTENAFNSLSFTNAAAAYKHIHIQINMHTHAFRISMFIRQLSEQLKYQV